MYVIYTSENDISILNYGLVHLAFFASISNHLKTLGIQETASRNQANKKLIESRTLKHLKYNVFVM